MAGYSAYTDQELAALLKQGDHAAFTGIFERYWKSLILNPTVDQLGLFVELFIRAGVFRVERAGWRESWRTCCKVI
jgi:hypothetical protein